MHAEALEFVARFATVDPVVVLDIGGRDINGTTRHLYPNADPYVVLDIADGPNVDVVADAAAWTPDRTYDVVLCTEVFEHTQAWPAIVATARAALRPGGLFVATMAGPGRPPHSAVDGGWTLHPGEHYANVHPDELRQVLASQGWADVEVNVRSQPADVRCVARRPGK